MCDTGDVYRLIDLDSSRKIGDTIGPKLSPAFAPPEMLDRPPGAAPPCSGCHLPLPWRHEPAQMGSFPLLAHPSYDAWGLGVLLFQMLARRELFSTHVDGTNFRDGDVDARELAQWDDALLAQKLHHIPAGAATEGAITLLVELLQRNPAKRPSLDSLKYHPYICGFAYDAFVSYRQGEDSDLASKVVAGLRALNPSGGKYRVFFDSPVQGVPGSIGVGDFQQCFITELAQTRVFVPLVSQSSVRPPGKTEWIRLTPTSPYDNVLLEYTTAYELSGRGSGSPWALKAVPIFKHGFQISESVGPKEDVVVESTDSLMRKHLLELGRSVPVVKCPAKDVWRWLTVSNGKKTLPDPYCACVPWLSVAYAQQPGGSLPSPSTPPGVEGKQLPPGLEAVAEAVMWVSAAIETARGASRGRAAARAPGRLCPACGKIIHR